MLQQLQVNIHFILLFVGVFGVPEAIWHVPFNYLHGITYTYVCLFCSVLQRMQPHIGQTAMGIASLQRPFWQRCSHGCRHIQSDDFVVAGARDSFAGVHRILRQQADRHKWLENWPSDGWHTQSAVCHDIAGIQFDCVLCAQSSRGWFEALWWNIKKTTTGQFSLCKADSDSILCRHLHRVSLSFCVCLFFRKMWSCDCLWWMILMKWIFCLLWFFQLLGCVIEQTYPKGVWFLFFKGRLEFMKGNVDDALTWYKKSWKSQDIWPQFHHICFWEILWVNWWVILRTLPKKTYCC